MTVAVELIAVEGEIAIERLTDTLTYTGDANVTL